MTQQKTVLVVEDDAPDLFPLKRAFRQLDPGFELKVVETGQDAVRYLQGEGAYCDRNQHPLPILIILDLRLPGMSGLDLLKWIRQQPQFTDLPTVALTAFGNRDLPRAYDLGINFYLLKPAEAHSLAEVLQALDLYQG
ncbi:response regulator [Pseudanabaena sp. FACHB-2040]|uniref:response regulator n=1 Tax=Pseudanabaena sp. FACHB-2040 TaxID=2692859 RepID=UPI001684BF98|nr:response regulator [Pseudanabaena sp. FACHB-2040]MBD2258310.1 response regulator [Pseudanabaena sp. FACHB-2040]